MINGKTIEIWEEIKQEAGVTQVTPDNIYKIKETILSLSFTEITQRCELKSNIQNRMNFIINPIRKQKMILHHLMESQPPTSLIKIAKKLGFGGIGSPNLSPKILEDMGLIKIRIIRKGEWTFPAIIEINRGLFKKYWPEIENWGMIEEQRITRARVRANIQQNRAFQIMAEGLISQRRRFTPPNIPEIIGDLKRMDFKTRGWEISNNSLSGLRARLRRMPISEFIAHLKKQDR